MTETEWFNETDCTRHVRFVEARLSPRKLRLLAVAFCRAVGHLHNDDAIHRTIEAAEEFADRNCTAEELAAYREQCRETAIRAHEVWGKWVDVRPVEALRWWLLYELAWAASYVATTTSPIPLDEVVLRVREAAVRSHTGDSGVLQLRNREEAQNAHVTGLNREFRALVWEVTGNPFSTIEFLPDWRTSTAVAIARQTYESRDFAAMPILADALQDAGCDNDIVLNHCRDPRLSHGRGCWVVDGVLKKS